MGFMNFNNARLAAKVFTIVGVNTLAALNAREREVLALLAEGLSNAGIGQALDMTANGANHHLKNIYRKLGVRKRTQAMAVYFENHRRSA